MLENAQLQAKLTELRRESLSRTSMSGDDELRSQLMQKEGELAALRAAPPVAAAPDRSDEVAELKRQLEELHNNLREAGRSLVEAEDARAEANEAKEEADSEPSACGPDTKFRRHKACAGAVINIVAKDIDGRVYVLVCM